MGSFENYCYSYLEWNRTAKSHSEHTLTNAHAHLKNFFDWCALREIRYPNEVTLSLLERYRTHVVGLKNNTTGRNFRTTTNTTLALVKDYFAWLARKRVLVVNLLLT
ncbi:site-specific integrase (plasmid) [Leptospira noguchii]|nr:site-specific integrase [Leptospira noguchii]